MGKIANKLASEPVRAYLYTVGVAVEGVLVARGVITGNDAPLYVGVLVALLGLPATELARQRVIPANGSTGAQPEYAPEHEAL